MTSAPATTALQADLRKVPVFDDLPDSVIDWFLANATYHEHPVGDYAWHSGDPADDLIIVLEGYLEVLIDTNGRNQILLTYSDGAVSGRLPFSRMKVASASGIAREHTRLLRLHRKHFRALEDQSYELMERLVGLMTDRVRSQTTSAIQQEKLVSLGKLSAGIAHELNNPSAAIVRAAQQLEQRLAETPDQYKEIMARQYTPEQVEVTAQVFADALARDTDELRTSLMARNTAQTELEDWLDDHNIPDAYTLVDGLLDCGIQVADLERMAAKIPDNQLPPVLGWLENSLVSSCLLYDIQQASARISELVASVKQYSHMDQQADHVPIDFAANIRSTLVMLGGKLKSKSVQVETHFPDGLPGVCGNPGQLNQVWTNLLDNALDALPDSGGRIRIQTRMDGPFTLALDIEDNGSGITPEVQARMWDAFYTTKPVGQGTGMGLEITKRILDTHQASIQVQSQPGRTVFTLRFPAG